MHVRDVGSHQILSDVPTNIMYHHARAHEVITRYNALSNHEEENSIKRQIVRFSVIVLLKSSI